MYNVEILNLEQVRKLINGATVRIKKDILLDFEDGFSYNFNLYDNPRIFVYYNIISDITDEELSEIETHLEIFGNTISNFIEDNIRCEQTSGEITVPYCRQHIGKPVQQITIYWEL